MRGVSMKGKSKKSTYSTTFGIDPIEFASSAADAGSNIFIYLIFIFINTFVHLMMYLNVILNTSLIKLKVYSYS